MQSDNKRPAEPIQEDLGKALALKKLALEIAEMERPWWKRPNYILAALPTLLAIVVLSVGFLNGLLQSHVAKLQKEKHDLEIQLEADKTKRTQIEQDLQRIGGEIKVRQDELKKLEEVLQSLQHPLEPQHQKRIQKRIKSATQQ